MPRLTLRSTLPLLLAIAAIAGCGKSSNEVSNRITNPGGTTDNGAVMDQAAIAASMADAPELIEDALAESGAETALGTGLVTDRGTALIRPVTFWRRIERVERRFEFAFSDTDSTGKPTTALVTVHKHLFGTFNILAGPAPATALAGDPPPPAPAPRDTNLRVIHKPLADHWVRRVLLKRVAPPAGDNLATLDGRPRWRIAATSGVQVTSRGATTEIASLRVQAGPLDTLITDPLALFRLRRILKFAGGDDVHLTVTTGRNDDAVLLVLRDLRLRFRNNGDNTYSGVFRAAWLRGVNHFGVNALSRGTLFDDAAPYDSKAWVLPYVVVPTDLAEFMP